MEVVLSCLRQTDFGPVLAIGSGGVAVELARDGSHLALPVSRAQVLATLRGLGLWTLLQGFRGKPPADVEALLTCATPPHPFTLWPQPARLNVCRPPERSCR